MRSKGFDGMVCSIADVMGALGDRWGVLVMRDLLLGVTRYDDLRRSTGITNATLSDRLKAMEQAGLVERRLYQARPDRYEYLPTTRGRDVALVMQAMAQVGDKWRIEAGDDRPLRFRDARTGKELKLAFAPASGELTIDRPMVKVEAAEGADDLMRWRLERGEEERASRRRS